jgi:hypothetical protein
MSKPGLSSLSIVGNTYNYIRDIKDAAQQIQAVSQSLERSFRILGDIKSRLDDYKDIDASVVDMALLGDAEGKLFATCQELRCLVAPYKNAAGMARRSWLVNLRWTLKKRQLQLLEYDLERWGRQLTTALSMAQW